MKRNKLRILDNNKLKTNHGTRKKQLIVKLTEPKIILYRNIGSYIFLFVEIHSHHNPKEILYSERIPLFIFSIFIIYFYDRDYTYKIV